jgi:inorganic pyrophosphatase
MSGIVSWCARAPGPSSGRVNKIVLVLPFLHCLGSAPRRAVVGGAPVAPDALAVDGETVIGPRHYLRGYPADSADGSTNAVVEIPAGTTGKFEVGDDGALVWQRDRDTGAPRAIDYLAFPVSYGMVPRTLAPDGDAIDIIVLGRGVERGRVARTRVIGVLEMTDSDGARDDKLIAVPLDADLASGFTRLHELDELDVHYPELRAILWLWFGNYWGAGVTHVIGWGDAATARHALDEAKDAFTRRSSSSSSSDAAIACARAFTAAASSLGTSRLSMLSAWMRIRTRPPSPASSTARAASSRARVSSPRRHAQYARPTCLRNAANGSCDSGIDS